MAIGELAWVKALVFSNTEGGGCTATARIEASGTAVSAYGPTHDAAVDALRQLLRGAFPEEYR
jgi:hypothetical protein